MIDACQVCFYNVHAAPTTTTTTKTPQILSKCVIQKYFEVLEVCPNILNGSMPSVPSVRTALLITIFNLVTHSSS